MLALVTGAYWFCVPPLSTHSRYALVPGAATWNVQRTTSGVALRRTTSIGPNTGATAATRSNVWLARRPSAIGRANLKRRPRSAGCFCILRTLETGAMTARPSALDRAEAGGTASYGAKRPDGRRRERPESRVRAYTGPCRKTALTLPSCFSGGVLE